MPLPELVGTVEAATLLGVDRSTLSRWSGSGRLTPIHKLPGSNGAALYKRADVEALREQLKAEALARFDGEAAS
jgi:predicted site-specific integrase-resolvase